MNKPTRIVSIDFGLKRIGMGLSDETKIIASSWTRIEADKRSEQTIALVVTQLERIQKEKNCVISEVVVGMPLMMSGKSGLLSDEVKHFIDLLKKSISIPIIPWDERLTSVQAERAMREADMSRKRRAKIVDEISAVLILQSYLDSKSPY